MRKLKLIWDFKGPDSLKIAQHHAKHLDEYALSKEIKDPITGVQQIHELFSIAYIVVNEGELKMVRDALKPHRGSLYQE